MKFLTRSPLLALALLAGVTALLALQARHVRLDYELEKFFPTGTPDRLSFDRMQRLFGRDDRIGLILATRDGRPLDAEDFRALAASAARLRDIELYERVVSPADAPLLLRGDDGRVRVEPALPAGFDDARLTIALDRFRQAPFERVVLSEDGQSATIAATMQPDRVSMSDRTQIRMELEAEAARLAESHGLQTLTGGYPVQRDLLTQAINRELVELYPIVVIVIVIVLALLWRDVFGTIAPLVVVVIAAVWTTGLMHVTGLPPNIFVAPVFVLTAVIGIGDSVHVLSRYGRVRSSGTDVRIAVEQTVSDLALPCFLTSFTTAMAFAALALSAVPMIAHFGLQTAIGVLAAYTATFLLVPPLLVLIARPVQVGTAGPLRTLSTWLARLDHFVARYPERIVRGAVSLMLVGAAGIPLININSPLLADLDREHPILATNRVLEERMAGVIGLELLLEPPSEALDEAVSVERLRNIEKLTAKLKALPEVITATSILDPISHFARQLAPPADPATMLPATLLLANHQLDPWIHEDARVMRIRMTVRDTNTRTAMALFERIDALHEEVLGESSEGRLTGQGFIGQRINARIVSHLQRSFIAAMLAVSLTLLIVLGDVRLTLASLLPNLLPVVLVSGLMGYIGIDLRYSSALVLTIVFGLAIDDTIHFVTHVRTSRAADPITSAFETAGPGIVLTSIILALGFAVLLMGALVPNRVLGGMLALTAMLALVGDLLLLPATLRLTRRTT